MNLIINIGLETTKVGHITTHQACTYCHGTKIFIKWKCEECAGTGVQIFGQDFGYISVPIWIRVQPISGGRLCDNSLKYAWKTDLLYFIVLCLFSTMWHCFFLFSIQSME